VRSVPLWQNCANGRHSTVSISAPLTLNKCDLRLLQYHMTDSPVRKLLVRKVGSNKFLRATGRWTTRVETAFSFPTLVDAIHTCIAKGLKEVEFILRLEGDSEDQCFALDLT